MVQPTNVARHQFDVYFPKTGKIWFEKEVNIVGWGRVSAPVSQSILPAPRVVNLRGGEVMVNSSAAESTMTSIAVSA